jgi:hypothetical protein
MKFSLKDLFWSVTLISLGIGIGVTGARWTSVPATLFFWFGAWALLGAGIGRLFHRTVIGLLIGLAFQFVLLYALILIAGIWFDD